MNRSRISAQLDWSKGDGLLPAVVQDAGDGTVLMLGYMNRAALEATFETGQVTFYSRSRQCLWTKGETSGNCLYLVEIAEDCDRDALLVRARPQGPTCHRGTRSCFGQSSPPAGDFLSSLEQTIVERAQAGDRTSYTARLLDKGLRRCAQKVGEEGVEVALAALGEDLDQLNGEAADLLYHLLVCLHAAGSDLAQVVEVLRQRRRR